MVRAQLRYLHSPDLPDLEHDSPADPECFGILVQAMVGPQDGPGEESFDIVVCTPIWLAAHVRQEGHIFGRHYLFLPRYDYHFLHRVIATLCDETTGHDWETVATRLACYGRWEFEDYRESLSPVPVASES